MRRLVCLDCSDDTGSESDWEKASIINVPKGSSQATAEELQPTSTYQFRLYAIDATGAASPASDIATLDTQVNTSHSLFRAFLMPVFGAGSELHARTQSRLLYLLIGPNEQGIGMKDTQV